MSGDKKDNIFYITHSGELLIWLVIILIIVAVSTITYVSNTQKDNDYNIFMSDVDGLIVGSPVRMMGIEVGHVTKIKPTNGEVYIKFLITDKSLTLPQGTIATVEFSGMAGSKSLELYLPDSNTYIDNNVPMITVNPPKRLHDAAGLLNDMFDKLNSILSNSSSFGNQIQKMDLPKVNSNGQNMNDFLKFADDMVNESNAKAEKLGNDINKLRQEEKHAF